MSVAVTRTGSEIPSPVQSADASAIRTESSVGVETRGNERCGKSDNSEVVLRREGGRGPTRGAGHIPSSGTTVRVFSVEKTEDVGTGVDVVGRNVWEYGRVEIGMF